MLLVVVAVTATLEPSIKANACGRSDVPCLEVPPCDGRFATTSSFKLDTDKSEACHNTVSTLCNIATLNGACLDRLRQAYGEHALPLVASRDVACDKDGSNPAIPECQGREWRCYSPLALRPTDGRWSNTSSAEPLAVCSGEGPLGEALRASGLPRKIAFGTRRTPTTRSDAVLAEKPARDSAPRACSGGT